MDDRPDQDPYCGEEELEGLLAGGFFAGLFDEMRRRFRNLPAVVAEDCLLASVEKMLIRLRKTEMKAVNDVKGYLATVAYNECRKGAKRQPTLALPDDEGVDPEQEPVDDSVLQDAAVAIIKGEIGTWENANVREVMLVCVSRRRPTTRRCATSSWTSGPSEEA